MKRRELLFVKTRMVKTPQQGTELSAGIDFFVPSFKDLPESFFEYHKIIEDTKDFVNDSRYFIVHPHEIVKIPSGIKVVFKGEPAALIAHNKSGVANNLGLDVMACVVDQDYRGEVHISLVNTTNNPVKIYEGMKIVQFILVPVEYPILIPITEGEYREYENTTRGDKGFGEGTGGF